MADTKQPEKAVVPIEPDKKPTRSGPTHPTIEEHAEKLGVDASTMAGVKVREAWPAMKRVTEHQFKTAVSKFVDGPTALGGNEHG